MIKRRFYRQDYGDGSDVSSSSSDEEELDEVEQQHLEEEEEEEEVDENEEDSDEDEGTTVTTRGHVIEGSSADDITAESSGEDDAGIGKRSPNDKKPSIKDKVIRAGETSSEESEQPPCGPDRDLEEEDNCILKIKSVFRCRICPRVVCLSETFLMAHLKSKKHAHSKKLLKEGRLKLTLNSDGELEEEQETHAERHARMVALAQKLSTPKKSKRKRQAWKRKSKLEREAKTKKTEQSTSEQPKGKQPKTKQPKESSGKKNAK